MEGWLFLALFGGTVGAFLDFLHTASGTIRYPDRPASSPHGWRRGMFGFAIVYSVAGIAFVTFLEGCQLAFPGAGTKLPPPRPLEEGLALTCVFAVAYALSAYGRRISRFLDKGSLAILFLAAAGVHYLMQYPGTWPPLVAAVLTAIIGPLVEMILSAGVPMLLPLGFRYTTERKQGRVPVWLPALYVLAAMSYGEVCRHVLQN
jgi:hypothetical protein